MRLGFVIYGSLDTMSGGYLYDRKLVESLRALGDTVEIISLPWRHYAAHLTHNFRFRLPRDFDLILEDELNHPSLIFANAQTRHFPVISLVHNLRSCEPRAAYQNTFYRLVERRYFESVDGFIFNSNTTRDVVHALAGEDKPHVIATPGGDRLGSIEAQTIETRAHEPGALRIVFLANVTRLKGLHILLKAISKQQTNFNVDVVGSLDIDPKYVREMQNFVAVNDLSSAVRFHGILDSKPLIEKLKQAHGLAIPSSYEGFGISYLEGMAFGLPAIGTTAGAIPSLIKDGENGYLISPDDSGTLSKRLQQLDSDRELLTRLSLNALKHFQSQPTWDQSFEKVRDFLYAIAKSKNSKVISTLPEIASSGKPSSSQ